MLEFTRNDKRFNESQLMNDFYNHIENNWYRLVDYDKKDNKVRIYSNYRDIKDVVLDYKNYRVLGFKRVE
jgi:hypothetical protein